MKANTFLCLAIFCAGAAIGLALADILLLSFIYLILGFISAALYWEKSNEEENVVDSEGKHTLFSVQAKKTEDA